jgi:hypothetical protein
MNLAELIFLVEEAAEGAGVEFTLWFLNFIISVPHTKIRVAVSMR